MSGADEESAERFPLLVVSNEAQPLSASPFGLALRLAGLPLSRRKAGRIA